MHSGNLFCSVQIGNGPGHPQNPVVTAARQSHALERRCEAITARLEAKEKEFWASGGDLSRNRDSIKQEMRNISAAVKRTQEDIVQMTVDPSTPLFLCRDLVRQSYESAVALQKSEAKRYSDRLIGNLYRQIMDRLDCSGLDREALRQRLQRADDEDGLTLLLGDEDPEELWAYWMEDLDMLQGFYADAAGRGQQVLFYVL